MKQIFINFLKGFGMGAANVIPGVSGGTIAIITGIFERLINSLKSFDLKAIKLLFTGKFKEFAKHTDFVFLCSVIFGAIASIMTLAKLLGYLFDYYPIYIWAFFFGLIIASVLFVSKTIEKWKFSVIASFIIGTAIAVTLSFLNPAKENDNMVYLFICGIAGVCSMILPGISGSFILVLMGNYQLIMIDSVINLTEILKGDFSLFAPTMKILIPTGLGMVFGLLAFSHFLSWIYKKFKDQTIAILAGFILGSLIIIWPWKYSYDSANNLIEANKFGAFIVDKDVKVFNYDRFFPEINSVFFVAVLLVIVGFATIWIIEKAASKKENKQEANQTKAEN